MNESEFLKSWPSLAPAVWRLERKAREKAEILLKDALSDNKILQDLYTLAGDESATLRAQLQQITPVTNGDIRMVRDLAMERDSLRAEISRLKDERSQSVLQQQNNRLTKELAEEREKVGEIGRWLNEKKEQLAAAQSALAEKEKELERAMEGRSQWYSQYLVTRAAREFAEKGRDEVTTLFNEQTSTLDSLRAQLQQAEQINALAEARFNELLNAENEARKQAERERDKQRDALQKQNAELLSDVERWKNFNDHPAFVAEIARLKARNADLVNALTDWVEWWETVAPKQRGPIYQESVKLVRPESLNQSPE